ncbi:MAG: 4-hydroxybutyryl-CoA dehydratase [Dehalococcoidia bacterium]|nr:4-hydroxybutyryl-CoA dehydratase [Dehalococcoidia bacterium]
MIRTVDQYLESLRDGRNIYILGEKVRDVTSHPSLRNQVISAAMDYWLPNDPKFRPLFVTKNDEGEDVHFLFTSPKSTDDLVRRREIFVTASRAGGGIILHCMGADALASCAIASEKIDKALGTEYKAHVEAYRKYLQKNDLGLTGAVTDVKGDRSLRPSKQVQHKDFYVRVVERRNDGIVVSGAKMNISATPGANEAIVLPCRAHSNPDDKDYAVAFATPLNAKGITLLACEPIRGGYGDESAFDYPVSGGGTQPQPTECIIMFENVFVPWERVFMCQEYEFSKEFTYAFAVFHRLFGCSRMVAELEMIVGAAKVMAEYNGLDKYEHIHDKLAWLAQFAEAVNMMGLGACIYGEKMAKSDLYQPNIVYANIAKFMFATQLHEAHKTIQDICGGVIATPPTYLDWNNPELRPLLEKYLGGSASVPTEHRVRMARVVHDFTGSYHQIANLHGEGSPAAQRKFLYNSAQWDRYKAAALRIAGIPGWQQDVTYGELPDFPNCMKSKMPPVDTNYRL